MSNLLLHITQPVPEGGWQVLRKGGIGMDLVEELGRRVKSTVAGVSGHRGKISSGLWLQVGAAEKPATEEARK